LKTLEELREVLNRKKFERYINRDDKEDFLRDVVDRSTIIEPNSRISICRDPKDNQILELAISGKANLIITGDDDLLVLNPFQSILIVTPDAWLQDFSTSLNFDLLLSPVGWVKRSGTQQKPRQSWVPLTLYPTYSTTDF
jgi:predicted nucleic acid-binding protein